MIVNIFVIWVAGCVNFGYNVVDEEPAYLFVSIITLNTINDPAHNVLDHMQKIVVNESLAIKQQSAENGHRILSQWRTHPTTNFN